MPLVAYRSRKPLFRTTVELWLDRARRLLGGAPAGIQAAALPWRTRDGQIEILLVTSRETGRWILPKGWQDGREALHNAARREAWEEAGIEGVIAERPIGSYFYLKTLPSGLVKRCEVRVYPLEVTRIVDKWPERRERDRRWLAPADAAKRVTEAGLAELVGAFTGRPRDSDA
jgi:8-oxo-dGTP pyrophosphatase MutT (NUDIX family)